MVHKICIVYDGKGKTKEELQSLLEGFNSRGGGDGDGYGDGNEELSWNFEGPEGKEEELNINVKGGAKRKKSKAKSSKPAKPSTSTATHTKTGEKYTDKKGVTRTVYVNTRGTQMVRKKDSNGVMVYTRI